MHHTSKYRSGFTLIELSIVLVIIGLIAGGVLVGRELIKTAQVRATITQIQKYEAAFSAFTLKYDCVPGDCANAVTFNLGTASAPGDNGDGNSHIFSHLFMNFAGNGAYMKESLNAWYHLSKAGLIEGAFTGYDGFTDFVTFNGYEPVLKVRPTAWVSAMSITTPNGSDLGLGNFFLLHGITPALAYGTALTGFEAFFIDTKLDDGDPEAGNIMTSYPWNGPRPGLHNGWATGCTENSTGTTRYDIKGLFADYANHPNTYNTPPNPGQIGCELVIWNAF